MAATIKPLILVTGTNQGLGFATAQQLASTGQYNLLIGTRSQEKAKGAITKLHESMMTDTLLPLLRASKYHNRRIVNVTSDLGQIGIAYSPTSEYSAKLWELPVYRSSKSAINMISAVDAVSLEKKNILCVLAARGYCRTNFGGGQGVKSTEEGAQPIVRAATEGNPKELCGKLADDENTLVEFGW